MNIESAEETFNKYRVKWTEERIVFEWLQVDTNRDRLLKLRVDEATWNTFRKYGSVIDFTESELNEGITYCSIGDEWVCLKKISGTAF